MKYSMAQILERKSFLGLGHEARFRILLEEFCAQAESEGLSLLPHRDGAWERFRTFSPEVQSAKVSHFEKYYRACASAVDGGLALRDSRGLFRRVTANLGLKVPEDFSSSLDSEDVIEIYSRDFTQLFRNLRFLEICSYSMAELYAFEWPELFRRPASITENLVSSAISIMDQGYSQAVPFRVPDHFLEEVFSPERHKFFVRQKLGAPVRDHSDAVVGIAANLSATRFDESSDLDPGKIRTLSH